MLLFKKVKTYYKIIITVTIQILSFSKMFFLYELQIKEKKYFRILKNFL